MFEKIKEQLSYVIIALMLGIVIGGVDAVFGRGLLLITDVRQKYISILIIFLPFAGLLITWLYNHFNKESLKGMTLVLETAQGKRDSIPFALIPLVFIGTWITHLFGGSAGREGVAVQIGATLSHAIARKFNLPYNQKIVLVAGMAAGFGGLFQTPFAALFFAMEVIVAGKLAYEAFLPAIIAAFTASTVSHSLGLEKFQIQIKSAFEMLDFRTIILLVIFGVIFGLVGRLFAVSLKNTKTFMANKIENPYKRIGFVSIPLALCLFILWRGRYCGLGTNIISQAFGDGNIYEFDWILKLILTVLTLSIGFQGGEVTPLFSIGASLGFVLGTITGLSPIACAALGYAAVFGSATNTVLSAFLIGIEVFGTNNVFAFLLVCSIAYIVNGNRCIYGAQEKTQTL